MKISIVLVHLLWNLSASSAFSPSLQRANLIHRRTSQTRVFSQWEDEDEKEVAVDSPQSFSDAGAALKEEEDKERMDGMGDFDENPAYKASDIDRVREAIKQRTESLGIEKSQVSKDAIKEAEERAKSGIAGEQDTFGGLDLSKISQEAPRGEDDSVPAMFYEPENEMSQEEMAEADPDGQLSFIEQASKEIGEATWPTPVAALKRVGLLIAIILFTAFAVTNWDNFLRELYTNFGFIPRPEDIMKGTENLALPDGWTNGMSEDDFMKFQDEVGTAASQVSSATSGFQDL